MRKLIIGLNVERMPQIGETYNASDVKRAFGGKVK
jgi:hypothetical protein